MYETLRNRIAALEEEEVHEEEEERRFGEHRPYSVLDTHRSCHSTAEEAQTSVLGLEENAIHQKYIELVSHAVTCAFRRSQEHRTKVCRVETFGT